MDKESSISLEKQQVVDPKKQQWSASWVGAIGMEEEICLRAFPELSTWQTLQSLHIKQGARIILEIKLESD